MNSKVLKYPRNIVFSPHVDDEVIGCYQALSKGLITDVVYFFELTDERKAEAEASAARFGFKAHFAGDPYFTTGLSYDLETSLGPTDRIWAPTSRDSHPDHGRVNRLARKMKVHHGCELMFYTVDMDSFQKPIQHWKEKKQALLDLFPSQKALFENEKYFLFEGYSEVDHITTRNFILRYDQSYSVVLSGYNPPKELKLQPKDKEPDVDYLDRLIVEYYNRDSVTKIAVINGDNMVEFNG